MARLWFHQRGVASVSSINFLTTAQAAERLGVTIRRVQAMIKAGRIKTVKVGQIHLIHPRELEKPEVKFRKPGRPKKED